jgi:predicted MFS family arabinose efflux permease
VPAVLTIVSVLTVCFRFPYAGDVALPDKDAAPGSALSPAFWFYAAAAAIVAFGFADYPLIAFHFAKANVVSPAIVPVFYAAAMGASGLGSLIFGRWFDRRGLIVLIPGLIIGAAAAPLLFLGGFAFAVAGVLAWGIALGVHDAIMSAAVARMVPEHARARAYGIFTAIYGIAWFAGSALLGALYDISIMGLVAVSVAAELAAFIPLAFALGRLK